MALLGVFSRQISQSINKSLGKSKTCHTGLNFENVVAGGVDNCFSESGTGFIFYNKVGFFDS